MARQASGGISFSTQTNGVSSVVASISNESQGFSASNAGLVNAATFGAFQTTISVFEGTTRLDGAGDSTDAAMSNGEFRLAKNSGNNTDRFEYPDGIDSWPALTNYSPTIVTTAGSEAIRVDAADAQVVTGAGNDNILRIHIRAKTSTGAIVASFVDVSLQKSPQGVGGNVIDLSATSETFNANFAGTLDGSQTDITVTISNQGTPGAYTYQTSVDGAAFVTQTATASSGAGKIKSYNGTTTGTISTSATTLVFGSFVLGTSNSEMQLKVTGAAGGVDTLSIKKLRRGQGGLTVVVNAAGGDTFGQGETAGRVTSATIYDDDTGGIVSGGAYAYTWRENSVTGDIIKVTSSSVRTVVQSGGVQATGTAFNDVTIDRTDATDNAAYVCVVVET